MRASTVHSSVLGETGLLGTVAVEMHLARLGGGSLGRVELVVLQLVLQRRRARLCRSPSWVSAGATLVAAGARADLALRLAMASWTVLTLFCICVCGRGEGVDRLLALVADVGVGVGVGDGGGELRVLGADRDRAPRRSCPPGSP